jgi:hypothetical protein
MNAINVNDRVMLGIAAVVATGLVATLFSLIWQWRDRKVRRREVEALRKSFEKEQMVCLEMFSSVHRTIATLEEGVVSLRQAPRAGGLNRSTRAQAMQMLRSGHSAEAAASSLGIGKREMRLLERVSQTLCAR